MVPEATIAAYLANLPMTVCWFETAKPIGPAYGDPEQTTWGACASIFERRREGVKDRTAFIPARFESEGRQVRRLARNVLARTAVALDIETNGKTGEVPPTLDEVIARAKNLDSGKRP